MSSPSPSASAAGCWLTGRPQAIRAVPGFTLDPMRESGFDLVEDAAQTPPVLLRRCQQCPRCENHAYRNVCCMRLRKCATSPHCPRPRRIPSALHGCAPLLDADPWLRSFRESSRPHYGWSQEGLVSHDCLETRKPVMALHGSTRDSERGTLLHSPRFDRLYGVDTRVGRFVGRKNKIPVNS